MPVMGCFREAEVLLSKDNKICQACRKIGVMEHNVFSCGLSREIIVQAIFLDVRQIIKLNFS